MRRLGDQWTPPGIAKWLLAQSATGRLDMAADIAAEAGTSDMTLLAARARLDYGERCRVYHGPLGMIALLTRDEGHHTSGWWKNPDYERCLHLSLSFLDPNSFLPRERDKKLSAEMVESVFGATKRLVWTEPPYSEAGKERDVYHYRVFYADKAYTVPLLPRGEVYSKEFTEAGWLSWSDFEAREKAAAAAAQEKALNGTA